jgi:hypothetical protein
MTMSMLGNNKDSEYINFYNSILQKFEEEDYSIREQWDLINFFTQLLFKPNIRIKDKKYLLRFLKTSSTLQDVGVNVNQELIYRYLGLDETDKVFNRVLIKIKSDDSQIFILTDDGNIKLDEFFNQMNQIQSNIRKENENNNNFFTHATKEISMGTKKNSKEREFYSQTQFICDQIEFYSNMCNSRNHTWKKLIEESFKYKALVEHLDSDLSFGI